MMRRMNPTFTQMTVTRLMRLMGAYWLPVPVDDRPARRRAVPAP